MRCGKDEAAHAARCAGAGGIADTLDGKCCLFRSKGGLAQLIGRNLGGVKKFEIVIGVRQPFFVRKAGKGVFRRDLRHRHRPLSQRLQIKARIGRNACHPAADEDAQGKIVAFRRFGALHLAKPHTDRLRAGADDNGIRLIRAGGTGKIDKFAGAIEKFGRIYF